MWRSLFLVLLSTICTFAPTRAQVLVTPVDASTTPVYFCEGARINTVSISYGVLNLGDKTVHVDSITFRGTRNAFTDLHEAGSSYSASPHSFMVATGGPTYAPPSVGFDTCWATAHVGIDTITSLFVCSALPSPTYSLLGNIEYNRNYGVFSFGGTAREELTDTLVDIMQQGPAYRVSASTQPHEENAYICFFTCAGAEIDSIVLRDTFTEFTFHDLPTRPVSVAAGDSLTIHYDFVPSIVGQHARPMVFYMHDGSTMVWEFEYTVRPASAVATDASEARYRLYPNPASTNTTLQLADDGIARATRILDINGRPVTTTFRVSGTGLALPVTNLPSGVYRVEIKSEQSVDYLPLVLRH